MRAAVTEEQHIMALEALAKSGISMTSNVAAARELGLTPVGTMGHEHVQRWGEDLAAFRAMRDMRLGVPSYLLDTFDTIRSGIPRAIQVMRERPHPCSIRYDSGDKFAQYMYAHGEFTRAGLAPMHILEDGLDLEATRKFEHLREFTGLAPEAQLYGYGGHFIARSSQNPLTRDKVAAVYKLGQTSGEARMKFGNEAGLGKRSVPGRPVVWRRLRGEGPLSTIGQHGETVPEDYLCVSGNPDARKQLSLVKAEAGLDAPDAPAPVYQLSPQTRALESALETQHQGARR
jgi:nicotinic acid phosphoribosyltransferase